MEKYRENTEALAEVCAANLARLGRLYKRDGCYRAAQEVLELAAKLGSLEAVAEMAGLYPRERNWSNCRMAG
jgi:uncharacterized protein HemY